MAVGVPAALVTAVLVYPMLGVGRYAAALIHTTAYVLQIAFVRVLFEPLQGSAVAWGYVLLLWTQAIGGCVLLMRRQAG